LFEKFRFVLPMLIMLSLSIWGLSEGYWVMCVFLVIVIANVAYATLAKVRERSP